MSMRKVMENDFVEVKNLRDKYIDRVEVLEKVSNLLLLPHTEYATAKQVAEFYEVDFKTIKKVTERHRDELSNDGCKLYMLKEILQLLEVQDTDSIRQDVVLKTQKGKTEIVSNDNIIAVIPTRGTILFPKRAILRIGMLLRDSEVAKEVRNRLLDIEHDTYENAKPIIRTIADEMKMEADLAYEKYQAELAGDFDWLADVSSKLVTLKNKRIKDLEFKIGAITSNALTIDKSRDVIKRIVRIIGSKENGIGNAFNELYAKANYKLGINIKARYREKGQSYLDTLTTGEMFSLEKIARSWAVEKDLDLDKILSLN